MVRRNNKSLKCKECGEWVYNVGDNAVAVTCSKCVQRSLNVYNSFKEDKDNSINNNLKTNEHEI